MNFGKPKSKNAPAKKKKLELVFDENARRDFLTGFHKRKVQRKTKAAEELQKQLKLEKKKIQARAKKMYQKIIQSQKPIPELDHTFTKEIDMGTHSVSVTEINPISLTDNSNLNEKQVNDEPELNKKNKSSKPCDRIIEGMEIKPVRQKPSEKENLVHFKSKKELKKAIKRETNHHVRKSKVFKAKSKLAQIKNKKHKRREEYKRQKQNNKNKKSKSSRKRK